MPSSITNGAATHAFISLGGGQPQGYGLRLADVTAPGVAGNAFREEAEHGGTFVLEGHVDLNAVADLRTTFDAMVAAYQGKVVTVVDDYNATHGGLVCTAVERVAGHRLARAAGGLSNNKGAYLVVRFTLTKTS
ncbi:MAG TPA: hypothetical protein VF796_30865 [Humisphaera sp.]